MKTIVNDYVVIPKKTWLALQAKIDNYDLSDEEKIEFGFVSTDNLTSEQKIKLEEAKKLNDSDFVNL